MQRILAAAMAVSLMIAGTCAFAATAPVGVVDYQKVAQAISFQKVMTQRLTDAMGVSRKTMTDLTTKISEKEKELKDKVAKLTPEQKKAIESTLTTLRQDLQKNQSEMQTKMTSLRQNIGQEIKDKLEKVLGTIAQKHNIEVVYTSMGVAYAANKVDLTEELIAELSKTYGRSETETAGTAGTERPGLQRIKDRMMNQQQ